MVWEVGNEDYVYLRPETYAEISSAFMRAIGDAAPGSRFALCCDSHSWADWSWREGMLEALRNRGMAHFDYASTHIYMTGAGTWVDKDTWEPFPWANGQETYGSAQAAWAQIGSWLVPGHRKALGEHGFDGTQVAITEFNVVHSGSVSDENEHSLGRALGEAMIYPSLVQSCAAIFFHDLVRNGPGYGNYFQRLDYYPDHRPGCRYHWQVDGAVMRLVQPHCRGAVFLDRDGVVLSRNTDGLYVSVCNAEGAARRVEARIGNARLRRGRAPLRVVRGPNLDTWGYEYVEETAEAVCRQGGLVAATVPPYSFVAGQLDEQG